MFVTCKITNKTSSDFPKITFRKFYQVIFWEKDFKTLNIYTNSVIGSEKDNKRVDIDARFNIEFSFSCKDGQNNNNIAFTTQSINKNSFLNSDINAWQAVWGDNTKVVESNDDFNEKYKALFSQEKNITTDAVKKFLYIKNSTKNELKSDTIASIIEPTCEDANNLYRINPAAAIHSNCEIVNLTLTTIKFTERQSIHLNYFLEFDESQQFDFLDNSIYFILPDGFDAKGKNASIYLKKNTDPFEKDNPFQTLDPDSKRYVQEWINKGIEERKYYRIYKPDFKSFNANQEYHKLHFNFRITSTVNPVISQLLYGFLIALFFTYGLDQTRLMNYRSLFAFYNIIPPGVNFFVTFALLFTSVLFKISIGRNFEKPISTKCRVGAMTLSMLWFLCLYVFPNPQTFYGSAEMSCPDSFTMFGKWISYLLNILALITNSISVYIIWKNHKDEIDLSLFQHIKQLFTISKN